MTTRLMAVALALAAVTGMARAQTEAAPAGIPQQQEQVPPAAPQPDVWDLYKSGQALAAGDGVGKDAAGARRIFEQVMASSDREAAAAAALALARLAQGDLNDPQLAVLALDRGIALGSPWCMIARAQQLATGTADEQKQAADLYLRALETETTPDVEKTVYYGLGQIYAGPLLLSGTLAVDYHRRAAERGNPWSLMALGGIYDKGTGLKRNWATARDYYEKALATDQPQVKGAAAYALAQLYSQPGHSAPRKSFDYLAQSRKNGNPWAGMMMADRYLKGLGVKKSTATARRLYTELRNDPDENVARSAALQLGRLYSTAKPRKLQLAEENLRFASDKGDIWASYFLAQLYIKQMPNKANRRKARELLNALVESDDATAREAARGLLKQL